MTVSPPGRQIINGFRIAGTEVILIARRLTSFLRKDSLISLSTRVSFLSILLFSSAIGPDAPHLGGNSCPSCGRPCNPCVFLFVKGVRNSSAAHLLCCGPILLPVPGSVNKDQSTRMKKQGRRKITNSADAAHAQPFSPKKARKGLVHFDSGCLDLNTRRSSKPDPTDIGVPILINHLFHAVR